MSPWQPSGAEPVDVVLRATSYLRPLLPAGTWVSDVYPTEQDANPAPAFVVAVRRDGGATDALLDRPRFAVNVWGTRRRAAFNLAAKVTGLLLAWPAVLSAESPVYLRCVMSPSLVPDDDPPHFYATFEAAFRSVRI